MNLFEARKYIKICLAVGVLASVCGLLSSELIDMQTLLVIELIAVAMFVICLVLLFKYCKCPLCGEQLVRKAVSAQRCPFCRKSLLKEDVEKELAARRRKAIEKAKAASEKARAEKLERMRKQQEEENF